MEHLLSARVKSIAESATLKMSRLAGELKMKGVDVISLSLGEPDFDTPDHIKEAAKKALDQGYTKYTPVPGLLELRQAICRKLEHENGLSYTPDRIVVSNGAKQSVSNIVMALLNPGDEAILITPYWVSYRDISALSEGKVIEVSAGIDRDYKISPEQLEAAINDKTKFVIFSSPCNPTGSVYSQQELEALAAVMAKFPDVLIVSDEIYEYINFTDKHFSIAQVPSIRDQVVIINGFSKGFAMTGWRLGYMAAPLWLAKACSKIQSQCTSGATAFGQRAAITALDGSRESCKEMSKTYLRRKELMRDRLNSIPGVKANDPEGAFYIFPDISNYLGQRSGEFKIENSDDLAEYLLTQAHVATVSGSAFGAPDCIRLSFAASDEELNEAMNRIEKALSDLR